MHISEHFTLGEFTFSQYATRHGIDNVISPGDLKNLERLAETMERVRAILGNVPIIISSGYRSPALNRLIGGAKRSAHLYGLACDFTAPEFGTPLDVCRAIAGSDLEWDQVIHEGRWAHLGLCNPQETPRMELLTASFNGGVTYEYGLR